MERTASDRPVFAVIGVLNEAGKYTYTDGLVAKGYPLNEVVYPDMLAAVLPGPDATRGTRANLETLHRTRALINSRRMFSRETGVDPLSWIPNPLGSSRTAIPPCYNPSG